MEEVKRTFPPRKLCACTLPPLEGAMVHLDTVILQFIQEFENLVQTAWEEIDLIGLHARLTGQKCIATDGIYPNEKGVEKIIGTQESKGGRLIRGLF